MSEKELSQFYWLKKEIKDLEDKIDELGYGVGSIKIKDVIGTSNNQQSSIQEKVAILQEQLINARLTALEKYIEIERYMKQ